ncbi:MAG TPA: phenylalanine--tRNA ligase subunit alpha [Acidobacteriota bacterium]|nr:phenylalanine--tRNA ligase subunit alpha [Acidobacteriota bacterium]
MSQNAVEHPLWDALLEDLKEASTLARLTEIRDKYLSRQRGLLTLEMRRLGELPRERRPEAGRVLNQLKQNIESELDRRQKELSALRREAQLQSESLDVTLPGYRLPHGGIHPIHKIQKEMENVLVGMGFTIVTGPEIETDYYNFEALNIPEGHPARDDQDTFYLTGGMLLRTHTSPVQIHIMEAQQPPLRIAVPGRVFRRDSVDATHSPMFHQLEVLVVGEGISMAHLKGALEVFLKRMFSSETRLRFRPSFFPFVEPGAEVDMSCIFCEGDGCRVCKKSGWIELGGAGMVHPRVLEKVGYDTERFTGFAWGMGIDRLALTRYQVDDLRLFFENDIRFLRQF